MNSFTTNDIHWWLAPRPGMDWKVAETYFRAVDRFSSWYMSVLKAASSIIPVFSWQLDQQVLLLPIRHTGQTWHSFPPRARGTFGSQLKMYFAPLLPSILTFSNVVVRHKLGRPLDLVIWWSSSPTITPPESGVLVHTIKGHYWCLWWQLYSCLLTFRTLSTLTCGSQNAIISLTAYNVGEHENCLLRL